MSKTRNKFEFTWVHAAAVAIGATAVVYALRQRGKVKEIASSAIPPAYPPGVGASRALGASKDLGVINLRSLWDPKIIVLRPGGSALLQATDWTTPRDGRLEIRGSWTLPHQHDPYLDEGEPFFPSDHGLYNVGGPSAHKIARRMDGDAVAEHVNLMVKAPMNWGPNDWAQIRLYRADVSISPEDHEGMRFVESVRIRTDRTPVQTVWIMGAQ